MAQRITFTMTVTYDEDEVFAKNALYAIEHVMFNIDGIYEWEYDVLEIEDVEYDEE